MLKLYYFEFKRCVFIIVVFILKCHSYEFINHVNQRFYTNASATNIFRFRNFEPRNSIKVDIELKPIIFDGLIRNIRKPRGFQFHADDRDFNVELEFIIPFIRIPIERSMSVTQTAFRSLFNLNLHSLLTTSGIVVIGGLFAIILKTIFTPIAYFNEYKKMSRNDDDSTTYQTDNSLQNVNQFIAVIESKLQQNKINISQCVQKSLCSYAQEKFINQNFAGEGFYQILDGVLSLQFVRDYLNGTAIQIALDTGNKKANCNAIFNGCNWNYSENNIFKLLTKYLKLNIT